MLSNDVINNFLPFDFNFHSHNNINTTLKMISKTKYIVDLHDFKQTPFGDEIKST